MKKIIYWMIKLTISVIIILACTVAVIYYVNPPFARDLYNKVDNFLHKDFYDSMYLGTSFEIINLDTMAIHSYKKKDKKELPASLVKLFTIDYALSIISFDEPITISSTAVSMQKVGSSTAHLKAGDILSAYDVICGMLLPSGNDAAYSLALYIGGKLNPKARSDEKRYQTFMKHLHHYLKKQGYTHTYFEDAAGYDFKATTTAEDLTKVTIKLLKNKKIAEIVTKEVYQAISMRGVVYHWNTTNKFMQHGNQYFTKGVKGVKTGSLDDTYNLCVYYISSSGNRYLLVSFGSDSDNRRYKDVQNLLSQLP